MSALVDVGSPLRTVSALNAREAPLVRASRVKRERSATFAALASGPGWRVQRQLWRLLADGGRLVVTLTRVSRGELDDDNLRGALKAVRDEVASWLRIDDRDPRVRWAYAQERVQSFAVRIRIEQEADLG